MPSVIATLKVQDDKVDEAKSLFAKLAADTLANESGTLVYTPHQRRDDPTTFVFFEKYEDDAAFALHGENLKSAFPSFASVLAGPPDVIVLEEV